ncbi:phage holin family protein [Corynebacterium mendelii]|uniref:Phage holin family protein n=1 Tax=Corynebacterium mendelii TaxID=2765362 RepID=A0A939DZN4_9CORY|nr:phage holin family protein [Corynebacterium mendelii]
MSKTDGLFTDGSANMTTPKVDSIPLSDVDTRAAGTGTIGQLVSDATAQVSSLVRGEIELAKTEIIQEAKKGAIGGGLFGVAGTIALYSSFFFFFFLAELLAVWLDRWAAFLIVFLVMVVLAALFALIGWGKVKKISKPNKTIDSVGELKNLVPGKAQKKLDAGSASGMFTDR